MIMPEHLVNRLVLLIIIFSGLFAIGHVFVISQSPSDGAYTDPNDGIESWQSNGVEITVLDSSQSELRDGDIVLEVEGERVASWMNQLFCLSRSCQALRTFHLTLGNELTYTVERDGNIKTARAILRPYPFWEVIRRSWGGLPFLVVTYLIFLVLMLKQPEEPSIVAMSLMASGFLGSVGWMFSPAIVDILNGVTFWFYQFATHILYSVGIAGLLHFTLVFPKPLPLVRRYHWIVVFPYITTYGIYATVLLSYALTTPNKLLWITGVGELATWITAFYFGLGAIAITLNYRSLNHNSERQRVHLVVFSLVLMLLLSFVLQTLPLMLFGESLVPSIAINLLALIIPITIVIAIRRYQLWAIDPIINRALVYLSLSAIIIGVYMVVVVMTGNILHTGMSLPVSILATGVVAVIFQPLRLYLQTSVDRIMYGERDDPAAVLTRLAHQLEASETPSAILPNLVQTIAHTLKIPQVAIWLPTDDNKQFEPVAVWGESSEHVEMIPLTYQNDTIGQLAVAPRGMEETFDLRERPLLNTIAALTANTVRAVQLSDELRRSRQRIVTAREDERRRLRRDLHDGLGPQLASQMLGLEAVAQLMPANPEKAQTLLSSLKAQAQEAMLDVRRLVYDLRPPALDDLGLIGALQQSASRYATGMLRFSFDVPQTLPELPAAVETAAYRIAQEAMTNVVRHAGAALCTVRLSFRDAHLIVEVRDNGRGLSQDRACGVGLQAMKERATELNGQFLLESLPDGGTLVQARLPLEVHDE